MSHTIQVLAPRSLSDLCMMTLKEFHTYRLEPEFRPSNFKFNNSLSFKKPWKNIKSAFDCSVDGGGGAFLSVGRPLPSWASVLPVVKRYHTWYCYSRSGLFKHDFLIQLAGCMYSVPAWCLHAFLFSVFSFERVLIMSVKLDDLGSCVGSATC